MQKIYRIRQINKFDINNGAKYFFRNISKLFIFIPAKKYIKYFSGSSQIDSWKSNGISEENIENITKIGSNFAPTFVDHHVLPDIESNGHCLINNMYILKKVIYIYIYLCLSYTLNPCLRNSNKDITLNICLFRSVKITKNDAPDKYKYSSYSIRFDFHPELSFTDGFLLSLELIRAHK